MNSSNSTHLFFKIYTNDLVLLQKKAKKKGIHLHDYCRQMLTKDLDKEISTHK